MGRHKWRKRWEERGKDLYEGKSLKMKEKRREDIGKGR